MLSRELKKLLKLSGGKIILSEGDLKESFVVMKLGEYLREKEEGVIFDEENCCDCDCFEDLLGDDCFCECHENEKDLDFGSINEIEEPGFFSEPKGLTDEELLSRINADIAELKERKNEEMIDDMEEAEKKDEDPKYESV